MFHKNLVKNLLKNKMMLALVLLVVVGGLFMLFNQQKENFGEDKEAKIYFFYVDWCPHCVNAKPEVANFKKNNTNANVVEVNCEEQPELAKEFGVRAYPTVFGVSNGQKVEFNNRVTENNLNDFYSSLVQ